MQKPGFERLLKRKANKMNQINPDLISISSLFQTISFRELLYEPQQMNRRNPSHHPAANGKFRDWKYKNTFHLLLTPLLFSFCERFQYIGNRLSTLPMKSGSIIFQYISSKTVHVFLPNSTQLISVHISFAPLSVTLITKNLYW